MNIYEKLGMKRVINAAGKMTALGVSTILDETGSAVVEAAQSFVEIEELYAVAGKKLASLIGSADCCIVNSASAGIALSVSSLIAKDNVTLVESLTSQLHNIDKREVVLIKGQNVNYGAPIQTMLELGGAKVVEVGSANICKKEHIYNAVNENTLAIYYVKSHHCVQKNMVDLKDVISVGKEFNVPIVVDAAAESDLSKYINAGASMAIYSGAKAISGPTSGFVACSMQEYADNMRLQFKGIGRTMKIGKEGIIGLLKAVELYLDGQVKTLIDKELLISSSERLNLVKGLSSSVTKDEGRPIYRLSIKVNEVEYGMSAKQLTLDLKTNNPAIYTRDHYANVGLVEIDPRGLNSNQELEEILSAIINMKG